MSIVELESYIEQLEMELAITTAGMKTLFGQEYQQAEVNVIRIKSLMHRSHAFAEIQHHKAVS